MDELFTGAGFAFALLCLGLLARRDWLRWFARSEEVHAHVIGYRERLRRGKLGHGRRHDWPIYRFRHEGRVIEVVDMVAGPKPPPKEGTLTRLTFPAGHPELARPPRPWMWAVCYGTVIYITVITGGLLFGVIER